MDDGLSHDRKTKSYFWGTVLTWVLPVPLIIGIFNSFRRISEQTATGLGAIAGGLAEGYVTFGLILGFVLPVATIVLLMRSFSSGHGMRTLFSILYTRLECSYRFWSVSVLVCHPSKSSRDLDCFSVFVR
jgi:hypothetical protein